MKKINKILFSTLLIFALSIISNVKAIELPEYKKTDAEPGFFIDKDFKISDYDGSYIIGSHIFTIEGSSKYDGILRTEHIMYASLTIGSNKEKSFVPTLEDMKVYYVDGSNVIDAYTGEEIDNFSAYIKYVDLFKEMDNRINDKIEIPTLSYNGTGSDDTYYTARKFDENVATFGITDVEDADFYQLAISDKKDGTFSIENQFEKKSSYYMSVPYAEDIYAKARACKITDDDYECSKWSGIISFIINLPIPNVEFKSVDEYGTYELYYYYNSSNTRGFIETYVSKSKNGEYTFEEKNTDSWVRDNYYVLFDNNSKRILSQNEFDELKIFDNYKYCGYEKDNLSCYFLNTTHQNRVISSVPLQEIKYIKARLCEYDENKRAKICGEFSEPFLMYRAFGSIDSVKFNFEKTGIFTDSEDTYYDYKIEPIGQANVLDYKFEIKQFLAMGSTMTFTDIEDDYYEIKGNTIRINYSKLKRDNYIGSTSNMIKAVDISVKAIYEIDGKVVYSETYSDDIQELLG